MSGEDLARAVPKPYTNTTGYLYVQVGRVSCKADAQAYAVRAKNYMTKVSVLIVKSARPYMYSP